MDATRASTRRPRDVAHDEELPVRHFFHGETYALASEARITHAAVRHHVDAEGGYVVHDETSDVQSLEGLFDARMRIGEDAGLETVAARVGAPKSFTPGVVAMQGL